MDKIVCKDSFQKLYTILKKILVRANKGHYLKELTDTNYILFHKFCLNETYEGIFEMELAKTQITDTNHTLISIITKYATADEIATVREIVKGIYSYVLIEKQKKAIDDALIVSGAESYKYQERFKTIIDMMQTTAFWSLFKSASTASEIIDLVFSERFIDDLFTSLLNVSSEEDSSDVTSYIKKLVKKIIDPANIAKILSSLGLITFPAQVTTTQINVYTTLRDYIREMFAKSEYLGEVITEIKNNQKTKTIPYKVIPVVESDVGTVCSDLNVGTIFTYQHTHSVKAPVVLQKLSILATIVFNTIKSVLLKKNGSRLYDWGILEKPDTNVVKPLDIESIKKFGEKCKLGIDDDLAKKFQEAWIYHWTTIINKEKYAVEKVDPEVFAMLMYCMLNKHFWMVIASYIVSDEKAIVGFSEYIEDFLGSINIDSDIKEQEIEDRIEEASNAIIDHTEKIKKLGKQIEPFAKRFLPKWTDFLTKISQSNIVNKAYLKKVVYSYKTKSIKGKN